MYKLKHNKKNSILMHIFTDVGVIIKVGGNFQLYEPSLFFLFLS